MPFPSRLTLLVLAGGAVISATAFGAIPSEGGLPLLAILASLLPLQLAALFWSTAAAPRPGSRPPASG